jgi:hypothetical protein
MRAFRAGFLLLLVMLPTWPALGQDVTGFVESIGFNRNYRPECWTPMLVNLQSTISEPAEYDVVVEQEDLDSDTGVYRRQVTLNAGRQEKFWVYFRPRTTRGSLPANQAELQRVLRVSLTKPGGGGTPIPIPVQTSANNIDDRRSSRSSKLVLVVKGAEGTMPGQTEYDGALGLIEDVEFVLLGVGDLPESELGYDAVDAVLWLDAESKDLEAAGSRKLAALEHYVHGGGHLVVCQPVERGRIEALAPLLPVEVRRGDNWVLEIRDRTKPEPLRQLAMGSGRTRPEEDRWKLQTGQFQLACAPAKPEAVVERWIDWDNVAANSLTRPVKNGSPFLARLPYGLGAVTWLAQDVTASALRGPWSVGWAHVWDAVFGWRNETRTLATLGSYKNGNELQQREGDAVADQWESRGRVDLGRAMLDGTDHTGKAGGYVLLAVFFFIAYWLVAGPGSYAVLAGKGRKHLSWTIFAASALAATLLTVGVVKLVLRGDPEVKHFTVVRQLAGEDALALSRIGLYIPRDGMQEVSLPGVSGKSVSTLHSLGIHPSHLAPGERKFIDTGRYDIPVRDDATGTQAVAVAFPYRSTLKKIEARRVGPIQNGITGGPTAIVPSEPVKDPKTGSMIPRGYIRGKLTNNTGADLFNVFIAFRWEMQQEWMLYLPKWDKGQTLDVEAAFNNAAAFATGQSFRMSDLPIRSRRGEIGKGWSDLFQSYMEGFNSAVAMDEQSVKEPSGIRLNLVVMSLFDRIAPQMNRQGQHSHVNLMRREGRELDLSAALMAGRVVVLAEAREVPLPFPMEVEGDPVAGEGSVFYQFVLPADRTKIDAEEAAKARGEADAPAVER